jgi:hypothetical protein
MTYKITNEDGEEIDVFTAEELEAQKTKAIEEFKTNNPNKTEELVKAQEELEKLKGKDLNFANLRKQKEDAEKKVEDILKGVDEKISTVKKEVLEGVMKDHYNETLNSLSGGDKETADKIELQYKRLVGTPATKDELAKMLQDASLLATGGQNKGVSSGVFSSAGAGRLNIKSTEPLSAEEKDMARKLASAGGMTLEEKDFNK